LTVSATHIYCHTKDGSIVKGIHKVLPSLWLKIFNTCFKLGCYPQVWKRARIISIPKTDKRKLNTVQGYRDISLLSIPGKYLKKLVMGRLNHFFGGQPQSKSPPPSQQYGFTAGRSTTDAIKSVTDFARRSRQPGSKCCLLAFDIEAAFDNAWHPGILARLWGTKMSKKHLLHCEGLLKRPDRSHQIRRCCKIQTSHQRLPSSVGLGPNPLEHYHQRSNYCPNHGTKLGNRNFCR